MNVSKTWALLSSCSWYTVKSCNSPASLIDRYRTNLNLLIRGLWFIIGFFCTMSKLWMLLFATNISLNSKSMTSQKGLIPVPPAKKIISPGGISWRLSPLPLALLILTLFEYSCGRNFFVNFSSSYLLISRGTATFYFRLNRLCT